MSVCCECCVLSVRGLCDGLITRPEESYRLWCAVLCDLDTGFYLDTGFSWFPCVYKQMLRWFPRFQVATTCFSCSPPDLNLLVNNFIFCIHVKQPLPPGDNPVAFTKYYYYYYYLETSIMRRPWPTWGLSR